MTFAINSDQITETGIVTELMTTAEAKAHLRVDISDDDSLIDGLITASRMEVELFTGRSFAQHTYRAEIASFHNEIVLWGRPIQSVTNINYYDTSSPQVLTTLDANVYSLYQQSIVRNYGSVWPTAWAIRPDAVQITYVTGYLDNASPRAGNLPAPVRQAMYLIIGDLYENREAQFTTGFNTVQENRATAALLNPYRVYQ
jgi:uncharacterized phiE125 gp8 family phage protein